MLCTHAAHTLHTALSIAFKAERAALKTRSADSASNRELISRYGSRGCGGRGAPSKAEVVKRPLTVFLEKNAKKELEIFNYLI